MRHSFRLGGCLPRLRSLTRLLRSPSDFPTVSIGEERLRITPSPLHTPEQLSSLVEAVDSVWTELGLKRTAEWQALGGRCGVGMANPKKVTNLWTREQLELEDLEAAKAMMKAAGSEAWLEERDATTASVQGARA